MGMKKYAPHHQIIFEALLSLDLDVIKTRKEAEEHLRKTISDPGVLQFLLKNLYWSDREKLEWRFNLHVLYKEIEEILTGVPSGRVDVKTLFIRGEKSNYILESDYDAIKMQFPNSEIVTIAGAGHWVHAERAAEFFRVVMSFID
jgi:pimeloyl-ACP methyl ester carboxylesterase